MVTDYEAAWIELQQLVASKTQHGREGLLVEMAQIASRHRVAGELPSLLRLYGVEVSASARHEPDTAEDLPEGFDSVGDHGRPAHHDRGGHDVAGTAGIGRAAVAAAAGQ